MNIFVTVLTLAAVFTSSEAGPQGRIINGQFAGERQFPFYVGISDYSGRHADANCGGVIISNTWVITAAHCVENLPDVTVHMGSTNFFTPERRFTIRANFITMHPDFHRRTFSNDIALIRTPHIEFTNKTNKVILPSMRDESDVAGYRVTAMGWGLDSTGQRDTRYLKYTDMTAMSKDDCGPHVVILGADIDTTLCAMTDDGSICTGDSGGPLIMTTNSLLVGISSFVTDRTCARGSPAGFVRITEYLGWIKNVTGVYRL